MGEPYKLLPEFIGQKESTQGSEPSQYLKEKKETSIPKVVASEIGTAQTFCTLSALNSRMTRAQKNLSGAYGEPAGSNVTFVVTIKDELNADWVQ